VLSNHYTSTHPDSWFTQQPIIVRRTPDAIISIVGRGRTVTRPGHVKEHRELTDQGFAEALTGEFALTLTDDEIATLVAAPTETRVSDPRLIPPTGPSQPARLPQAGPSATG